MLLVSSVMHAQTALDFDGVNDYAYTPALTLPGNDNFTIEVYAQYKTPTANYQGLACFSVSTGLMAHNGRIMYMSNNTAAEVAVDLTDGQWYHFAVVRRAGNWEMYIDGVFYPTQQLAAPNIPAQTYFFIGGRNNGECWNGAINEVRVWSVARTAAEISAYNCINGSERGIYLHYTMDNGAGSTTVTDHGPFGFDATLSDDMDATTDWIATTSACQDASCGLDILAFTQSPVCISGSADLVSTTSGNNIRYTLRNDADDAVVAGPVTGNGGPVSFATGTIAAETNYNVLAERGATVAGALDFDGNNQNAGSTNFELDVVDNLTLETYFQYRITNSPLSYTTISGFAGIVEILIESSSNRIMGSINNGSPVYTNTFLTPGEWYHVAVVRRATVWEIYLNGVNITVGNNAITPELLPYRYFSFGGRNGDQYTNTTIDEVRFWNVARTATEIADNQLNDLAGNEPGLVAYYPMEDGTGSTTVYDQTGNGHNLNLYNMDPATDWVSSTGLTAAHYCTTEMKPITVKISQPNTGIHTVTACDLYFFNGHFYAENNNTATDTLVNTAGCDSIVTLNLTIKHSTTGTDVQSACDAYEWIDGIVYTESNNTATFALENAVGCDSVVTLNLTIRYSTTGTDEQTACDSYEWIDGIVYTESNNTATFALENAVGCDSIVVLDLTINHSATGTDVQTACDTYEWIDGVVYTENNNTATYMLETPAGCDSVVTLNLTIHTVNTDVTQEGAILTSAATGAVYQWIRCEDNTPIEGATAQTLIAPGSGDYAVIVTQNNCEQTSDCFTVHTVGIADLEAAAFNMYPNPNTGTFVIETAQAMSVSVISPLGQIVATQELATGKNTISLQNIATGIYMIRTIDKASGASTVRSFSVTR